MIKQAKWQGSGDFLLQNKWLKDFVEGIVDTQHTDVQVEFPKYFPFHYCLYIAVMILFIFVYSLFSSKDFKKNPEDKHNPVNHHANY